MAKRWLVLIAIILILLGAYIMPDAPDWHPYRISGVRDILSDMGELAVRLGSIKSYDRRGSVFWMTDMSLGMSSWQSGKSGDNADVRIDTSMSMYGGFSLVLEGGSTANYDAYVYRKLTPHVVNKWGLEIAVAFPEGFEEFHLSLQRFDGTKAHTARIILSDADQKIYYWDDDDSPVELGDLPQIVDAYSLFHCIKLVADYENDIYVGLWLDDNYYPMTDIPLAIYNAPDYPMSYVYMKMVGLSGDTDRCHVDYVIMTTGEP